MGMTALLSKTDFVTPPYSLSTELNGNSFNTYCLDEQKDILRKLLGTPLFLLLDAEFPIVDGSPQIYKDLVNGAQYDHCDKVNEYQGLASLLKPYIYYRWVLDKEEAVAGFGGSVKGKPENGKSISSGRKLMRASLDFLKLIGDGCNYTDSLYGFMKVNIADYPDWQEWERKDIPRINLMGI